MANADEKPKVRVVKAGKDRPKSGVIRTQDKYGKTWYRAACDRCGEIATQDRLPLQGKEVVCPECRWIVAKGKPSTRVKRKHDKVLHFNTECDLCGDRQETPFLPKRERPFLCDGCFAEEKKNKPSPELESNEPGPWSEGKTSAEQEHGGSEGKASIWPERGRTENRAAPVPEPDKRIKVTCWRCRTRVELRFQPPANEYFMCKNCYMEESSRKDKRKERPEVQTWFNIECAACGKLETVDFVPQDLTEPMCTSCFEKRKRRR